MQRHKHHLLYPGIALIGVNCYITHILNLFKLQFNDLNWIRTTEKMLSSEKVWFTKPHSDHQQPSCPTTDSDPLSLLGLNLWNSSILKAEEPNVVTALTSSWFVCSSLCYTQSLAMGRRQCTTSLAGWSGLIFTADYMLTHVLTHHAHTPVSPVTGTMDTQMPLPHG